MQGLSEQRRSPPTLHHILPSARANHKAVHALEKRCMDAGIKMTDLRRVLLHGIVAAGPRATVVTIWKILGQMTGGHTPSQGSIQRNLNLLVERDILQRDSSSNRFWHYHVVPVSKAPPAITFVEAGTGRRIACDTAEIATLLRRVAAEHGMAIQTASITVTSLLEL